MRSIALLGLLLVVSPFMTEARAQTPRGDRPRMEAAQERRAQLEQQVHRQFVARAAGLMGLDAAQRGRLDEVLSEGAAARRELARESRRLRVELIGAVRDEGTPIDTYQRLLDRTAELREREQGLARREDRALAEFLDPRQRAMFLVLRIQMSEQVRGMRGGRGEMGPAARRGPPGG